MTLLFMMGIDKDRISFGQLVKRQIERGNDMRMRMGSVKMSYSNPDEESCWTLLGTC
jgi:hypothetical protein